MKKAILAIAVIATLGVKQASSQDYIWGIGVRVGSPLGLTVKYNMDPLNAIEGIAAWHWYGFNIVGLYEHHWPLNHPDGLRFLLGAGAHIGSYNGGHPKWKQVPAGSYITIGVDGIIGFEYTLSSIPLNLQLDFKPAINIIGFSNLLISDVALSLRYAIGS